MLILWFTFCTHYRPLYQTIVHVPWCDKQTILGSPSNRYALVWNIFILLILLENLVDDSDKELTNFCCFIMEDL